MALYSLDCEPHTRYTLLHLNARVLLNLATDIEFPEIISMNLEEERFVWEVSLLGNLGSCFHCLKNGHTKEDCLTIDNVLNPKFDSEI